jgi:hypothetical protein
VDDLERTSRGPEDLPEQTRIAFVVLDEKYLQRCFR